MYSEYVYGTYGRQGTAWQRKIASCGGRVSETAERLGGSDMPELPDAFEKRAREVLEAKDPP